MTLAQAVEHHKTEIRRIASRHGVRRVRVFGSLARGESRPDSDLDLLVEAGPRTSSWFPAGFILDLEKLLGLEVDVVTEGGLHPLLRDEVLRAAVEL